MPSPKSTARMRSPMKSTKTIAATTSRMSSPKGSVKTKKSPRKAPVIYGSQSVISQSSSVSPRKFEKLLTSKSKSPTKMHTPVKIQSPRIKNSQAGKPPRVAKSKSPKTKKKKAI